MENRVYTTWQKPAYRDVFIRVILSLIGAHFIVVYGDTDDIGKIIRNFDYYNALIASFIIAFLLLYYIWIITRYLDQKLDWFQHTNRRIAAQLILGVFPAAGISVFLAWVYFSMYGHKITETPYFDSDFPVILLFIFLANIYYFLYYLIANFWPRDDLDKPFAKQVEMYPTSSIPTVAPQQYKKIILVQTPLKSIPIPVKDIAYFFRENKQNYMRTNDGEIFETNIALEELEAGLDPADFFRINRQMIICFSSCKEIRPTTGPRLELILAPTFNETVLVSETKVPPFRSWIER